MSRNAALVAAVLGLNLAGPAHAQWLDLKVPARPATIDGEAGRAIYGERCWFCHGEQGNGEGPIAEYLWPRPRDFTTGTYLLRSTASGELPTDEDLYRTISLGIPGTAMPAWDATLTPAERWQTIAYLKTFSADLFGDSTLDPYRSVVKPGRPPRASHDSLLARGKRVFATGQCGDCHGQLGRGDGGKGADLKDDWHFSRPPADLAYGWKFKGGSSVPEIYLRLTTGLNGTPMPSYAETLSDEDRWNLAYYVASLDRSPAPNAGGVTIIARKVEDTLPRTADAPAWDRAPVAWIPLTGQATFAPRWQNPAVTDLEVKALYTTDEIALRLAWDDRTADSVDIDSTLSGAEGWQAGDTYPLMYPGGKRAHGHFVDAAEVMSPARWDGRAELPHFVYGGRGHIVDLWRWRADRASATTDHPAMALTAAGPDQPPVARTMSESKGTARGVWVDGRWTLLLRRPLSGASPNGFVPVAFHVWDGGSGETGLRMAVSSWYFLRLEQGGSAEGYLIAIAVAFAVGGIELGLVRWARRRAGAD